MCMTGAGNIDNISEARLELDQLKLTKAYTEHVRDAMQQCQKYMLSSNVWRQELD